MRDRVLPMPPPLPLPLLPRDPALLHGRRLEVGSAGTVPRYAGPDAAAVAAISPAAMDSARMPHRRRAHSAGASRTSAVHRARHSGGLMAGPLLVHVPGTGHPPWS